jgi:hypothetical protein
LSAWPLSEIKLSFLLLVGWLVFGKKKTCWFYSSLSFVRALKLLLLYINRSGPSSVILFHELLTQERCVADDHNPEFFFFLSRIIISWVTHEYMMQ